MSLVHMWPGALTDVGARVRAKVTGSSTRLAVDTDSAFPSPTFFGPQTPTADGMVTFDVTGLAADTQHYYAIEDDSVLDTGTFGGFHTVVPAGTPYNFMFAAAGCAGSNTNYPGGAGALAPERISDHPIFDEIMVKDPLFFIHLGDFHYYNLGADQFGIVGGASVDNYRRAYDDILVETRQGGTYRQIPIEYIWDDHCYGPNNSDGTFTGKDNAAQVYRERAPHYPLEENGSAGNAAIYRSFQIGRVLFIVTDLRYHRDPADADPPRTMLGAAQVSWFENELATSTAALVIWVCTQPPSSTGTGSWGPMPAERQQILDMFTDYGWDRKALVIASDQHQLSMDSGSSIGMPLYVLGSLDSTQASGPHGVWDIGARSGPPHYGTIEIADQGGSIRVTVKGWSADV